MSKLSPKQIEVIKDLNENVPSMCVQAFMVNLFEVLRLKQDLEQLKQSQRFPSEQSWKGVRHVFDRKTIYDYLVNDSKVDKYKDYVQKNQETLIDAFKDSEIIKSLTEYVGTKYRLFKTTNGYLYICTSNQYVDDLSEYKNVVYFNIKNGKICDPSAPNPKNKILESMKIIEAELKKIHTILDIYEFV